MEDELKPDSVIPNDGLGAVVEHISPDEIILRAVSDETKKADVRQAIMLIREESYSGPIPSPKALQEYDVILPGAADRIIKMAESQQIHRMSMEQKAITEQLSFNKRGQILGFIIFCLGIAVAIFFACYDMKTFAGIFLTGTMVTIISIFVSGKREAKKDLAEKSKDQP